MLTGSTCGSVTAALSRFSAKGKTDQYTDCVEFNKSARCGVVQGGVIRTSATYSRHRSACVTLKYPSRQPRTRSARQSYAAASGQQALRLSMEGGNSGPILKDVVLLGGGHSHVEVLRRFGMDPMPGVRLTLITKDVHTPYSGMLPGLVAGFYTFDECHVDLAQLCTFASARMIHAEAIGIDKQDMMVLLQGRPAIAFDVLSVDVGITPSKAIPGSSTIATPVKPISGFVDRFNKLLDHACSSEKPLQAQVDGPLCAPQATPSIPTTSLCLYTPCLHSCATWMNRLAHAASCLVK